MKGRAIFRFLHRWCGILLGGFIVLAGLTGAVMSFQEELDNWLNEDITEVAPGNVLALTDLISAIEKHYPAARVRRLPLDVEPGRAWLVDIEPRAGHERQDIVDQIWVDPTSGTVVGERL